MSDHVDTDRRAAIMVLLRRPEGSGELGSHRTLDGHRVLILGEASDEHWGTVHAGDLSGIVWTTPRQMDAVLERLRGCRGVIDAKFAGTPRRARPPMAESTDHARDESDDRPTIIPFSRLRRVG